MRNRKGEKNRSHESLANPILHNRVVSHQSLERIFALFFIFTSLLSFLFIITRHERHFQSRMEFLIKNMLLSSSLFDIFQYMQIHTHTYEWKCDDDDDFNSKLNIQNNSFFIFCCFLFAID